MGGVTSPCAGVPRTHTRRKPPQPMTDTSDAVTTTAPSPAPAEANEISWKVVMMMYAVGVVICAVMGAIQVSGVADNLDGSWLIFAPFGPCLMYATFRHFKQAGEEKPKTD